MKNFIFLFFIVLSCSQKKSEIRYMSLYSTTIKSINCNDLLKSSQIKKLNLTDKKANELVKIFSQLDPADSGWKIDARVSGFIYDDSKKLNFCMSGIIIDINGAKYFVNDNLRNQIIQITNKQF